jgi:hypothetical protein
MPISPERLDIYEQYLDQCLESESGRDPNLMPRDPTGFHPQHTNPSSPEVSL